MLLDACHGKEADKEEMEHYLRVKDELVDQRSYAEKYELFKIDMQNSFVLMQ